jgi:TRAP-type C4-dicarboxylate transport system permease small subunit
MMPGLFRLAEGLCRALSFVGAAAVVAMMLHISLDVTLRTLFRVSMNTAPEIVARYYMTAIAFLPLGLLHLRGQMVSVELLDFVTPPAVQRAQGGLIAALAAAVYAVLAHQAWLKALREARTGTLVEIGTYKMAVWHSFFLPAAGFTVAVLACVLVVVATVWPGLRGAGAAR